MQVLTRGFSSLSLQPALLLLSLEFPVLSALRTVEVFSWPRPAVSLLWPLQPSILLYILLSNLSLPFPLVLHWLLSLELSRCHLSPQQLEADLNLTLLKNNHPLPRCHSAPSFVCVCVCVPNRAHKAKSRQGMAI